MIADNLSKACWSWGCVSAIDSNGRTISIADAHRDDGKCFIVRFHETTRRRLVADQIISPLRLTRQSQRHSYVVRIDASLCPRTKN